jgi:hypothetical protein
MSPARKGNIVKNIYRKENKLEKKVFNRVFIDVGR